MDHSGFLSRDVFIVISSQSKEMPLLLSYSCKGCCGTVVFNMGFSNPVDVCLFSRGASASNKSILNYFYNLCFVDGSTFCRSLGSPRKWWPVFLFKYIVWLWPLQSFVCGYDHYSAVAFGNARITLWRRSVLCLQIRYLIAAANLRVVLIFSELCCGVICTRHESLSLILPSARIS